MSTQITLGNFSPERAGVGNVNPTMIRERAIELAVIDGRTEAEVSPEDLEKAENELRADLDHNPQVEQGSEQADHVALVEQGLTEAAHDAMVESGKKTVGIEENDR